MILKHKMTMFVIHNCLLDKTIFELIQLRNLFVELEVKCTPKGQNSGPAWVVCM